jgi:1,4-alpha-glucan branching enzyme
MWSQDTDPAGFACIDANDSAGNTFSFVRSGPTGPVGESGSLLACIANFSGGPHEGYRLGLPRPGRWSEVLNTDAEDYAGSGVGNLGAVYTEPYPHHGLPHSARLRVPPLATLWLRWDGEPAG